MPEGTILGSVKSVLFDLDGTLLDTAPDFIEVVTRLRLEHDLEPMPDDIVRAQVSNGARALVTLALGFQEEDSAFPAKRQRLLDIYQEVLGDHTILFPGLSELLIDLEARGIPWGIVTNKPAYLTESLLARLKLQPAPATVICPDHVTHTKPHPEPMLLACEEIGCAAEETIYVGDHLRDIQAGLAAGMTTIAAAYGYLEPADKVANWQAHHVAQDSQDLHRHISPYL